MHQLLYGAGAPPASAPKGPHVLVHARQLHVGGVVGDVHERGVDHLVVHRVLRAAAHAARARVQVVDEQRAPGLRVSSWVAAP